jgi:hypothetical protein
MREAANFLPINHLNLPEGYHRSDLIDPNLAFKHYKSPQTQDELHDLTGASTLQEALSNYQLTHSSGAQDVQRNQRQKIPKEDPQLNNNPHREDEQGPEAPQEPEREVTQSKQPITDDYRLPNIVLNHRHIQASYVPLNYDEGYPTQPDGRPFWQKLPCEPHDSYLGFQSYIEQGTQGRRQLFTLSRNPNTQAKIIQHRIQTSNNISQLERDGHKWYPNVVPGAKSERAANLVGPLDGSSFIPATNDELTDSPHAVLHEEFVEWYYLYHWEFRARAHDLFYIDSIRKSREMLALQLENTHHSDAARLYAKIIQYINPDTSSPDFRPYFLTEDGTPRFWERLTGRSAIELLKLVTELQRVSIGLIPNQPSNLESLLGTNVRYLANQSQRENKPARTHGSTVDRADGVPNSQQMDPQDRTRRLAILLDKARARKEASSGD